MKAGDSFEEMAKSISADRSAKRNGGHIGYISALFPKGLYYLESAAYGLPLNQLSGPIRTAAGYHLLLVHQRRPARGEMEAAHILLRIKDGNEAQVQARMDSLLTLIRQGTDFHKLAQEYSEDKQTASEGGHIGFIGINRYEPVFEDAAFGLASDGDVSQVIKSRLGYHIIKRISKKKIQPFEVEKGRLEAKISQDPRFEIAKTAMLVNIKSKNNFKENLKTLEDFAQLQNDTFLTFRWKEPKEPSKETLFKLADEGVSLGEFTSWLRKASRKRIQLASGGDVNGAIKSLYQDFVNEKLMEFEETHLEEKYPEFKALMREYREGILLFEATKMLVWDEAGKDTVGLEKFYESVKGKYRWGGRARTKVYEVHKSNQAMLPEIRAYAAEHNAEEVLAKFNTPEQKIVNVKEFVYEKNRNVPPSMAKATWKAGTMSPTESTRTSTFKFYKFEEMMAPEIKDLSEARGYVIADYQDYLEGEWVKRLEKEYKVKVNEKVFERLIRE